MKKNYILSFVAFLFLTVSHISAQTVYEAENGITNGPIVKDATNASNGKVVTGFEGPGFQNKITNVDGGIGGTGTIKVRYSNGNALQGVLTFFTYQSDGSTAVNAGKVNFPPTGDWNTFAEITIPYTMTLTAGIVPANNFKFRNEGDVAGVDLDNFTVTVGNPPVPNPIVNGGFEDGITGWQKSWGNWSIVTDKHSGSSAAMLPLAGWGNGLVQRFNVDPQSVYEFKFWAKTSSKGTDLPIYLSIKNGKGQNIGPDPNYTVKVSAKDWTEYAIKFQTIELMDSVDLWIGDGKTDTLYLDDLEVNKSEFISNGGFESGKDGWQKSWGNWTIVSDSHSGSAAALVPLANWGSGLVQRFNAEELSPYELKFWAKVAASSKKVDIKLGLKNSAGKNVGPDPNFLVPVDSKEWKQYSYKFNTLATVDSIDFWLGDGTTDSLYIDDIELIPATIIANGSFEAGISGWGKSWGTIKFIAPGQSGDSTAVLALNNWGNGIGQRFNVDAVTSYEMKLWAKVSGTKPVDINLSQKNSAGKNVGPDPNDILPVSSNTWKEYKLKFNTLAEVDSIDFWIGGGTTDSLFIDNVTVAPLAFTSTTGIALDSTSLTLKTNGTYKLKVTITPATATNKAVKWVSSDPLIATVDENGTVKAITIGVATITATTLDGGLTASSKVTVESPTGIQNQLSAAFKVYPNPVISRLTIENNGAIGRIVICSLTGQVMMNSIQSGSKANIDLSGLTSGIYILKVYQKETVAGSFKIIKK